MLVISGHPYEEWGIEMEGKGEGLTKVPTVTPAATEGIDPVLIYPNVPPPAVSAPRM